MKRICLFICFCFLSLAATAVAGDEIKLGTVDLAGVMRDSDAGKRAKTALKELFDKYQARITAKEKELEKLKKAYIEKGKTASPEKRVAMEKNLQKKFEAYQEFGKNAQADMARKEKELLNPIMDGLEKLVKDYGRANGYAAIAIKNGLVYNDARYEAKDISDKILKEFNNVGKTGGVSVTSSPRPGRIDAIQGRLSSAEKRENTGSGRK